MQIFTLILAPYIPLSILIGIWLWHRNSADLRSPVDYKLLRSPGESLMQEIEKLDEYVSMALFFLTFGPCIFFASTFSAAGSDKPNLALPLVAYALISIPILYWLWGILTERSKKARPSGGTGCGRGIKQTNAELLPCVP